MADVLTYRHTHKCAGMNNTKAFFDTKLFSIFYPYRIFLGMCGTITTTFSLIITACTNLVTNVGFPLIDYNDNISVSL